MFEGFSLRAPNQIEEVLNSFYGANFMEFPQTGVLHHNVLSKAERSKVDLLKEIDELRSIYERIRVSYMK